MCCASLQTFTTTCCELHAYCAGVAPFWSGPYTSGGRRQMPPASHVQGENPAARWGQSEAELHTSVQPLTRSCADVSHAAGAIHAEALVASQGASALTHTRTLLTAMQP